MKRKYFNTEVYTEVIYNTKIKTQTLCRKKVEGDGNTFQFSSQDDAAGDNGGGQNRPPYEVHLPLRQMRYQSTSADPQDTAVFSGLVVVETWSVVAAAG